MLEPGLALNRALGRSRARDTAWRGEAIPQGADPSGRGRGQAANDAIGEGDIPGEGWSHPLRGGVSRGGAIIGGGAFLEGWGAFWETAGPILRTGASGGRAGPTGE